MIGTEDFTWKDHKLYLGKKFTGFEVNLEYYMGSKENEMWRVYYPDGKASYGWYNLSRAKNHCISEASIHFNTTENGTR